VVMEDFFWISGALWLDAVNCEWISGGARVDGWRDDGSLQAWFQQAGARYDEALALRDLTLGENAPLQAAKHLRASLRRACEATRDGNAIPQEVVDELNSLLSRRAVVLELEISPDGPREREVIEQNRAVDAALYVLARSALRSWTRGDLARLRPCANPNCILWFLDTSKNGTRRWCSMQGCGNRNKVSAHYERRAKGAGEGAE